MFAIVYQVNHWQAVICFFITILYVALVSHRNQLPLHRASYKLVFNIYLIRDTYKQGCYTCVYETVCIWYLSIPVCDLCSACMCVSAYVTVCAYCTY